MRKLITAVPWRQGGSSATILDVQSNKTSSSFIRRGETRRRAPRSGPFATVRVSSGLIAFYPNPIHQPQPYVILLDHASGILRRVDLHSAK
jgi:hypothetical protein